jgi:plasmid stabilization system protein ParE
MIRLVIIRPPALEDIAMAATWYEDQRSGLGEELVDKIVKAIGRAEDKPDLFRILRKRGEIRRVLTDRFPYRIFFSIIADTLYVLAVLHAARHDRHWKPRA